MLAPSSPLSLIRIEHGQARLEYREHILVIGSGEFGTDHVPQATSEIVQAVNERPQLLARVAQLEAALKNLVAYYQPRDVYGIWAQAQVALRDAQSDASTH